MLLVDVEWLNCVLGVLVLVEIVIVNVSTVFRLSWVGNALGVPVRWVLIRALTAQVLVFIISVIIVLSPALKGAGCGLEDVNLSFALLLDSSDIPLQVLACLSFFKIASSKAILDLCHFGQFNFKTLVLILQTFMFLHKLSYCTVLLGQQAKLTSVNRQFLLQLIAFLSLSHQYLV